MIPCVVELSGCLGHPPRLMLLTPCNLRWCSLSQVEYCIPYALLHRWWWKMNWLLWIHSTHRIAPLMSVQDWKRCCSGSKSDSPNTHCSQDRLGHNMIVAGDRATLYSIVLAKFHACTAIQQVKKQWRLIRALLRHSTNIARRPTQMLCGTIDSLPLRGDIISIKMPLLSADVSMYIHPSSPGWTALVAIQPISSGWSGKGGYAGGVKASPSWLCRCEIDSLHANIIGLNRR